MKCGVVTLSTIRAAGGSFSAHTYLDNPCAQNDCGHGEGQHQPLRAGYDGKSGKPWPRTGVCTSPGCGCAEYLNEAHVIKGLA